MNNLPGSPWKRSGIIARAGVKTGGNYIRHHVGNALPIKSLHQDKENPEPQERSIADQRT